MTSTAPPRWVYTGDLAYVLTDGGDDAGNGVPAFLTLCGLGVATTATVYRVPPSLDVCRVCVPLPGDDRPAPPARTTYHHRRSPAHRRGSEPPTDDLRHQEDEAMTPLPLGDRSHRFAIGTFQHLTRTRSAAECQDAADQARTAAASSPDESRRVRNIAKAAWWASVSDRVAAGSATGVGRAGS